MAAQQRGVTHRTATEAPESGVIRLCDAAGTRVPAASSYPVHPSQPAQAPIIRTGASDDLDELVSAAGTAGVPAAPAHGGLRALPALRPTHLSRLPGAQLGGGPLCGLCSSVSGRPTSGANAAGWERHLRGPGHQDPRRPVRRRLRASSPHPRGDDAVAGAPPGLRAGAGRLRALAIPDHRLPACELHASRLQHVGSVGAGRCS